MGGATLGYALSRRGHRVLFLEKGRFLLNGASRGSKIPLGVDGSVDDRLRRGHWPLRLQGSTSFGDADFFAPLGCGTGGTTNLYASQLERFRRCDFQPRSCYAEFKDSTLPEAWPITYDEILPYYRSAEQLYLVTGTQDPLEPDAESHLLEPPPLSPRDNELFESFIELGLHPYRAHAGFRFFDCCDECGGRLCPFGCKSDAGTVALLPALQRHGARLVVNCEVTQLEASRDRVNAVRCRVDGKETRIRGKLIVLAAGAFMSPLLLLNSTSKDWPNGLANQSDAVGRNLMLHASDFIAVRPSRRLPTRGPRKALALNDFYIHRGTKLGAFQSVGIEVNAGYVLGYLRSQAQRNPAWWRTLARPFLPFVAAAAARYYRSTVLFATIVEDLPYWENRVLPDPHSNNGMRFNYQYTDELKKRTRLMRESLRNGIGRRYKLKLITGDNNINYGHVCGTCRFGDDPATSVLDRNNRAHDVSNLYVVDASFFPSSGGTNVSLTIAANALRVADSIDDRLRSTGP